MPSAVSVSVELLAFTRVPSRVTCSSCTKPIVIARLTTCLNRSLICFLNFLRKLQSVTWSGVWPLHDHMKSILFLVTYSSWRPRTQTSASIHTATAWREPSAESAAALAIHGTSAENPKMARVDQFIQNPHECVFWNRFVQRRPEQQNLLPVQGGLGKIEQKTSSFLVVFCSHPKWNGFRLRPGNITSWPAAEESECN